MNSNQTANTMSETSLRKAALIAGIGLLIMVIAAPYAEFYAYGGLVVWGNAEETAQNITANKARFLSGLFGYLITLICDVFVAWALYVLLSPVSRTVSLLTGWFRVVYAVLALAALSNVAKVLHILSAPDYLSAFETDQLHAQVMLALRAVGHGWDLGFAFFSIHLGLLGYLVFKSGYIPKVLGILLMINGLGYFIEYVLKPYLFPGTSTGFLMVTYFGEVIFMLWLFIRGRRIREPR